MFPPWCTSSGHTGQNWPRASQPGRCEGQISNKDNVVIVVGPRQRRRTPSRRSHLHRCNNMLSFWLRASKHSVDMPGRRPTSSMSPEENRSRRRHIAMTIKIPPFKLVPQPLSQAADQRSSNGPAGTDRQLRSMVRCEQPKARNEAARPRTWSLRGLAMVSLAGLRLLSVPKKGRLPKNSPSTARPTRMPPPPASSKSYVHLEPVSILVPQIGIIRTKDNAKTSNGPRAED
jgi:hypothetical protein